MLEIKDNGTIIYDGMVVGKWQGSPDVPSLAPRLTLNLGWLAAAGIAIVLQDDPESDHHRGGVAFARP